MQKAEEEFDGPLPFPEFSRRVQEEERKFWTCPKTGRDCRTEPRPVIGFGRNGECQLYANAEVCPSVRLIELARGMTADYLLDAWLHYAMKRWIDHKSLNETMRRVAWHFGNKSWVYELGKGPTD
jgi:hypothetical protein